MKDRLHIKVYLVSFTFFQHILYLNILCSQLVLPAYYFKSLLIKNQQLVMQGFKTLISILKTPKNISCTTKFLNIPQYIILLFYRSLEFFNTIRFCLYFLRISHLIITLNKNFSFPFSYSLLLYNSFIISNYLYFFRIYYIPYLNALTYHDSSFSSLYFFITKLQSLNLNCLLGYLTDDTESRDTNKTALAELNHIYSSKSSRSFLFCLLLLLFIFDIVYCYSFSCIELSNADRTKILLEKCNRMFVLNLAISLSLSLSLSIY